MIQWFDARQASKTGAALADKLTPCAARIDNADAARTEGALQTLIKQAGAEVHGLGLNFYQRAKLANAFKWKLIENGVEKKVAHEVTQFLVVDISAGRAGPITATKAASSAEHAGSPREIFARANRHAAAREYDAAIEAYRAVLNIDPRHAAALNNMGSALLDLGRFVEAERNFRGALSIDPNFVEAHRNLGDVLRLRGYLAASEASLRHAVKLKPNSMDALCSLGLTLASLGATHDAKGRLRKVLKSKPRHVAALQGLGQIAFMEGRWDEAEKLFEQILGIDPKNVPALVAQAGARKMTPADTQWLETAEAALAEKDIAPHQEAALRYAIGKYLDDVGDFGRAFPSFRRANEVLKAAAEPYDRKVRAAAASDLIKAHSRDAIARAAANGGSDSTLPVLIVGMPRSGTSLIEQIIASHPDARGVGALDFWSAVMHKHETEVRKGPLAEAAKAEVADSYLRALQEHAASTPTSDLTNVHRIVDRAPVNSDYLGIIHSVFPKARIIYVQRDPVDTCLSCYFQHLPLNLNFALDLDDLSHYYREHQRLIEHWRAVLPPGSILDVPYESVVADQEAWTRKIIEFIGLDWNDQCLNFEQTQRVVSSASFSQVRRKIYNTSVARWRNYQKLLGPLVGLKKGSS
jgi:tetratricopeptide (TPR) repeat protein